MDERKSKYPPCPTCGQPLWPSMNFWVARLFCRSGHKFVKDRTTGELQPWDDEMAKETPAENDPPLCGQKAEK